MKQPHPGQVWLHNKGRYYEVLAVSVHTETEEICVVYRETRNVHLRDDAAKVWHRPLSMFMDGRFTQVKQ